ncbi:MAG: shikimate kinase [Muribaculaceae bacterium]|nr:shikimate kinase [Muribaculaceae bacterium]
MRPIFLIGFMGCGKTTLGHAVAQLASIPLVDLDDYIEQKEGRSIRQIFADSGEDHFREIERHYLTHLASEYPDAIIACGGGTPCREGAVDLMLEAGRVVWLQAPVDTIHARLCLPQEQTKRPLIAAMDPDAMRQFIIRTLEVRSPFYSLAPDRFDASQLESAEQIRASAERFIDQYITQ